MGRFYVYGWFDPAAAEPFYIGKGTGHRAWEKFRNDRTLKFYHFLLQEGFTSSSIIKIIEDNLDEGLALSRETNYIEIYKTVEEGGTLLNYRVNEELRRREWVPKIKETEHQKIIELYAEGKSMKAIGEIYGVHNTTIWLILRNNKIKSRHDKRHKQEYGLVRNQILKNPDIYKKMYETKSVRQIASEIGADEGVVHTSLKQIGIKIRGKSSALKVSRLYDYSIKNSKWSKYMLRRSQKNLKIKDHIINNADMYREMYKTMSIAQIADIFGGQPYVYKDAFQSLGMRLKTASERTKLARQNLAGLS